MKIKNEEIKINEEVATKVPATKKDLSLEEKIAIWKAAHGRIYKNTIDGESIIWRAVKRGEYKQLLKINEDLEEEDRLLAKQEATVKMVTLYPENIEELIEQKAGLATVLSDEILAKSGFDISTTEAL